MSVGGFGTLLYPESYGFQQSSRYDPARMDSNLPSEPIEARAARRFRTAIAALRRGAPVVVTGAGGAEIALAAELATDDLLALTRQWASAAPGLLITANRAAILHVLPTGEDVILLPLDDHYDAAMIRALIDPTHDLDGTMRGPLKRSKAAVTTPSRTAMELVKAALLLPAIVAAPLAADEAWAEARGIAVVSVEEIALMAEAGAPPVLDRVVAANVPLEGAEASRIVAFRPGDGGPEHLAIVIGQPTADAPVLVRLHSECLTGDLLGSLKCDCGAQLKGAIHTIAEAGSGVVLYLAQEGRGIGLVNKLRAYRLQEQGFDTIEANERLGFKGDERGFRVAAEMLKALGFTTIRLLTNNPDKVAALEAEGITVAERVPHAFPPNNHNESYLATKKKRSGHYL